jgi:nondiscriminating glutamyl-tRNA synthetase
LDAKRAAQRAAGMEPHYDGSCRKLDPQRAAERRAQGATHTMRFRVPDRPVIFEDRVRGSMRFESSTVGDFVLLRSNGMPTYNCACVVDDAAMRISHVLRGEDHLTNTMRQVLIYEAFGFTLPEFAHLSLIVDADRAKLKKREGQEGTYVDEYRTRGYLPGALVNFLALLGWSSPSGDEVLTRDRLVAEFDLDRVGRAPSVFDVQKLHWMAGEYLRAAPLDGLARASLPFLREAGLDLDAAVATRMLAAFRDGMATLSDLPSRVRDLLQPGPPELEAAAALQAPGARRLLNALVVGLDDRMASGPVDGAAFKALLLECGKTLGVKGRDLFMPVRAAISGRTHGPEIPLLFDALAAATVRERLASHAS